MNNENLEIFLPRIENEKNKKFVPKIDEESINPKILENN